MNLKLVRSYLLKVIIIGVFGICLYIIEGKVNIEFNMNATYDFAIDADRNAPVFETQQLIIPASPEKVWQALTEINQWPEWQKIVSEAKLYGSISAGTEFDWKAGGLGLKSRIHTCNPVQYFGWTGKTIGASAIHNWRITPHEGGTLVEVSESLDGIFPRLLTSRFSVMLREGMSKNLHELKERAQFLSR